MNMNDKPAVLFVDDEPNVLDGLRDSLRSRRKELRTVFANGAQEALEFLERETFDVVVSDMRMPGFDGAQLLERVRDEHAEAVRVILSGQASEEAALRMVPVAHIALAKPCTGGQLGKMLERACAVRALLSDPALRASVHQIGALPSPPAVAQQLLVAVEDEDVSAGALAEIVAGDVALAAKVLQLVNSGFFGLAQEITDLQRGISLLGFDLLRTLAVTNGALREFRPIAQLRGFSMDAFESYSRRVASVAGRLVEGRQGARTATSAGLLHDVGVLVLASRVPEKFSEALAIVERERVPLHEAEEAVLGVAHPTVGAYLLALWGLPEAVVDAVAQHHALPAPTDITVPQELRDAIRIAVRVLDDGSRPQHNHLGALSPRDSLLDVAPAHVIDAWLALADPDTDAS
jgi:HD-like signal output (HDOD) protein